MTIKRGSIAIYDKRCNYISSGDCVLGKKPYFTNNTPVLVLGKNKVGNIICIEIYGGHDCEPRPVYYEEYLHIVDRPKEILDVKPNDLVIKYLLEVEYDRFSDNN